MLLHFNNRTGYICVLLNERNLPTCFDFSEKVSVKNANIDEKYANL